MKRKCQIIECQLDEFKNRKTQQQNSTNNNGENIISYQKNLKKLELKNETLEEEIHQKTQ